MRLNLYVKKILVFLIIGCGIFGKCNNHHNVTDENLIRSKALETEKRIEKFESQPEDVQEARSFTTNYVSCCGILSRDLSGNYRRWDEIVFTVDEMKEILNMDNTHRNSTGISPDKIVFRFGMDSVNGKYRRHIITYGSHDNLALDYSYPNTNNNRSVFDFIPFDHAYRIRDYSTLVDSYVNNVDHLMILSYLHFDHPPFLGFTFDAYQIRRIIEDNAATSIANPNDKADKVILRFGTEDPGLGGNRKLHIIAYGKLQNTMLDGLSSSNPIQRRYNNGAIRQPSVYDKADPYPPR